MITGLFATLSKYRVVTRLGSGGMAEVYLVFSERPGGFSKLQVLKLMRSDLTEQEMPDFLQMFQDEARLAARLNHPNIVQSFEVGTEDGQPYIVMEFLEGQTLHRVQQRARHAGSGFPLELELFVLCQALEGLEYAHHLADYEGKPLHIVHRDISPQNVFVTYSGQSKLVDFGVAKTLESSKTRAGVVKGKVAYMPPEQVTSGPIDHRADLFSVGVLLWEAIAGQTMHADLSVYESMSRLVRGDLPRIRDVAPHVPPELERIVQRALELDPNRRYQEAESFRSDLLGYLDSTSKVRARDVGNAVAQLFARERSELSQIIRRATTSTPPPPEEGVRAITRRLPVADNISGDTTEAAPVNTPAKQHGDTPGVQPKTPASQPHTGATLQPRAWRIGGLALLLVVAAVIALFITRSQSSEPREPREPPTSDRAAATHTAPSPERPPAGTLPAAPAPLPDIQIAIAIEPSHATLTLDGRALGPGPYRAHEPRDAREHTLTVNASGYLPLRRTLRFDADIKLDLQLEKAHAEPPAPKAQIHGAGANPRREAAKPARVVQSNAEPYVDLPAPKRSKRSAPELDKGDPWGSGAAR